MKMVLLSYGDYISFQETVPAAIADLLAQAKNGAPSTGTTSPPSTPPSSPSPSPSASTPSNSALSNAVAQINSALAALKVAQQSGDPAAYGQALKQLQDAVAAYQNALNAASPSPKPTPTPGK
jgi:hypothetical protein